MRQAIKAPPQTAPMKTAQSSMTQDSAVLIEGSNDCISLLSMAPQAIPMIAAPSGRKRSSNESSGDPRNLHSPKESNPIEAPHKSITPPLPVSPTTYWITPIINIAMMVVRMRVIIRFS